jgi:hypothetical protein
MTAGTADIAGYLRARGAVTVADGTAAIVGNDSYTQPNGVMGYAGSTVGASGIFGKHIHNTNPGSGVNGQSTWFNGVEGTSQYGNAVYGYAVAGYGGKFESGPGGFALVLGGRMSTNNSALVTNLNADKVDGYDAASLFRYCLTNSGEATVSSGSFEIVSAVSGYQFSGSGRTVTLQAVSDQRLKTDIKDEPLGLDFIMQLRPKIGRMKHNPALLSHFFLMQDLYGILGTLDDELSHYDFIHDRGLSDKTALIGPIVNAIQTLSDRVDRLTTVILNKG